MLNENQPGIGWDLGGLSKGDRVPFSPSPFPSCACCAQCPCCAVLVPRDKYLQRKVKQSWGQNKSIAFHTPVYSSSKEGPGSEALESAMVSNPTCQTTCFLIGEERCSSISTDFFQSLRFPPEIYFDST
jgi:hypothetical protein